MQYIMFPSTLEGFTNTLTTTAETTDGRSMYLIDGSLESHEDEIVCPKCGAKMHVHDTYDTTLRHLTFGWDLSSVRFTRHRYRCPHCHGCRMQEVPFKSGHHRITVQLENFTKGLLSHRLTNKAVLALTGLGKNTVKDIDMERPKGLYTTDGTHLRKPERTARFLGVDEFKLHDGHQYAVVIIDLDTGHVLWLAHGKKKQAVYDFIDFVGEEWMDGVEAVACDMNSDFQEAFEHRCEHIQVVFDRFHIVKNFNDKVIGEVRKDEQRRLIAEGDTEGAKMLKSTKYILTSSRRTLDSSDTETAKEKTRREKETIFGSREKKRMKGKTFRYDQIMEANSLLFTADLIKEKLSNAYSLRDECLMAKEIGDIMDLCSETKNKHFLWFSRLIDSHFEGASSRMH